MGRTPNHPNGHPNAGYSGGRVCILGEDPW